MDYDDLLNQTWEELPENKNIPAGGWLLKGTNVALIKPKEEDQDLKVLFTYNPKEPISVPQDLLDDMGDYDFTGNDIQFTVYIRRASDWNDVKAHLAKHGVELSGALLNEAGKLAFAKAFRGTEVIADIGERSYQNAAGDTVWQNTASKFQPVVE